MDITHFLNFTIAAILRNRFALSECSCNVKGTEGGTKCEHDSIGNCRCQESAQGQECGECKDGYYGYGTHSFRACKGTTNLSLKGRDAVIGFKI